ncbi:MAG: carbon-nitrogen hydrolase family protein [Planctomycetota bacterium]
MFLAACVQLRCTTEVERNLDTVDRLVRRAANAGATLVATPENTAYLGPQFHKVANAEPIDGKILTRLGALANELKIHLLIGSVAEQRTIPHSDSNEVHVDEEKCFNTSVLFGPSGNRLAAYRKIHLFDVDVPGGISVKESDSIVPGSEIVVAEAEPASIGMSICYDLRFGELYRALVEKGAQILSVPSAFTLTTGKDHWHALLRARAIENQCWVIAPAQWGTHDKDGIRKSYGHSLIVDPWGAVVADKGQGEGLCLAEIDLDRVTRTREAIPVKDHRRIGIA